MGHQLVQLALLVLQGRSGGGDVQRLVGLNRRMLQRAAKGAGLAWLQGQAVRVQALDAAFLVKQLLLVCHLLLQGLVLRAQRQHGGILFHDGGLALLQFCCQRGLLVGEVTALLGQRFELLPTVDVALLGLPLQAQGSGRLSCQALVLFSL